MLDPEPVVTTSLLNLSELILPLLWGVVKPTFNEFLASSSREHLQKLSALLAPSKSHEIIFIRYSWTIAINQGETTFAFKTIFDGGDELVRDNTWGPKRGEGSMSETKEPPTEQKSGCNDKNEWPKLPKQQKNKELGFNSASIWAIDLLRPPMWKLAGQCSICVLKHKSNTNKNESSVRYIYRRDRVLVW